MLSGDGRGDREGEEEVRGGSGEVKLVGGGGEGARRTARVYARRAVSVCECQHGTDY